MLKLQCWIWEAQVHGHPHETCTWWRGSQGVEGTRVFSVFHQCAPWNKLSWSHRWEKPSYLLHTWKPRSPCSSCLISASQYISFTSRACQPTAMWDGKEGLCGWQCPNLLWNVHLHLPVLGIPGAAHGSPPQWTGIWHPEPWLQCPS